MDDDKQNSQIDADEFLHLFAIWRNEGLTPLASVVGYSELLLKEHFDTLTDTQQEYLQIIYREAEKAADCWRLPGIYLGLKYGKVKADWQDLQLEETLEKVLGRLGGKTKLAITIDLQESLPSIRGENFWLELALEDLIYPRRFYRDDYAVRLEARLVNSKIDIAIVLDVDIGKGITNLDNLFYAGSPLSVAKLIIEKLYRESLGVYFPEKGIVFRFSLPLWNPEIDA